MSQFHIYLLWVNSRLAKYPSIGAFSVIVKLVSSIKVRLKLCLVRPPLEEHFMAHFSVLAVARLLLLLLGRVGHVVFLQNLLDHRP